MKSLILALGVLFSFSSFADVPREVIIKTEKINDAVHWTPEKIEVTQGEKLKLVAKHELEGGFNFHGLTIKALNIKTQVDRNSPLTLDVEIPKKLTPGEYDIGCQYHPAHKPAKLVVKAAEAKPAAPAMKSNEKPAAAQPDAPASTKPKKMETPKGK